MSYSTQATEVFNRLITRRSSGTFGPINDCDNRAHFTEANVGYYMITCDADIMYEVTRFTNAVAESRSHDYQHTFFLHLLAIKSTIDEMTESLAELMMFQCVLRAAQNYIRENWYTYSDYFEPVMYTTKCCYFKIQAFCYQALVRSIEDEDEYDDVNEVIHLSNKFTHLYGICCRVLWGVVGRERLQDRLEREEAAALAAQSTIEEAVDQAPESSVEQATDDPKEADKVPDEELVSNPDDETVEDSDTGENDDDDDDDDDDDETQQTISSFFDRLEDCKCLGAVLMHELGPSKIEKQEKLRKKLKKLYAWRRRIQGIATEDDILKPSPLSLPPLTLEPDTNEQIGEES